MGRTVTKTFRPFMRLWSAATKQDLDLLQRPLGVSSTHVPGAHPLRMLLMGTGIAMGYGVLSHDLAVPGHLARSIASTTGRGVDIDVFAELEMTPERCRDLLREIKTTRYDAVVLMIGMWDCLSVTDAEPWGVDLSALIDDLHFRTPIGQDIFVVTVPLSPASCMVVGSPRWVTDFHAGELNAQIHGVCALKPTTTAIILTDVGPDDIEQHRTSQTYRAIAERLAPTLIAVLSNYSRPRLLMLDRVDEAHRQEALDRLNIVDTEPEDRFDRIATLAQRVFGTSAAAISFIDGNRQWFKARRGIEVTETPRRDAICDVTIASAEVLIVEDATLDYRFMDNPTVRHGPRIRFYAGHPIEAPGGERVGTICIIDTEPRLFGEDDALALRRMAMMVQDELWTSGQLALV